jgi:hypothetical protein
MKMKTNIKSPSSNEDRREDLKELRGLLLSIYQTGIPVMQSHTGKSGWPMEVVWRIANQAA